MNKYEALFILDAAAKEEAMKETIDRLEKEIQQAGGRVETVQKMGQRPLSRNIGTRGMGFYVNVIFQSPAKAIAQLDVKFHLETDLIRWQFTLAQPEPPPRKPRRLPTDPVAVASRT